MITSKWPRLLVVGKPVTPEQASEIIIRTNDWRYIHTNDKLWKATIENIAHLTTGYPLGTEGYFDEDLEQWLEYWGILELNHLHTSRLASSWLVGPHGWCDWDGTIGCANYNIESPHDESLTDDWSVIAAAFPYLDLRAQCIEDEGAGRVAAQWRIRGGYVEYDWEPTERIAEVAPDDPHALLRQMAPGGLFAEHGCDVTQLQTALERFAETRKA